MSITSLAEQEIVNQCFDYVILVQSRSDLEEVEK